MKCVLRLLLAAVPALFAPTLAGADGAWTTYQRATTFVDLLPTPSAVWCATSQAGLLRFDRSTRAFETISRQPGGLASNHLASLAFDRSGRLWVATTDAGVSRLSADGLTWGLVNDFDGLPSLKGTVVEAHGDTVWIGTEGGLALWNGREVSGALPDGVNPSPFASDFITGIAQDGDSLWVTTTAGAYRGSIASHLSSWVAVNTGLPVLNVDALASDGTDLFALANTQPYRLTAGDQWAITGGIGVVYRLQDDAGSILASTDSGLWRWSGSAWIHEDDTLLSNPDPRTQFAMGIDAAGAIFAADRNGLFVVTGPGAWTRYFPPGPPGNNLLNVALEGSRVYVNTLDEGIGRFDGTTWKYWFPTPSSCSSGCDTTFIEPLFSFALLVDTQGHKWFGCWSYSLDELVDYAGPADSVYHRSVTDTLGFGRHTWAWASAVDSVGNGPGASRPAAHGRWFGMDTPSLGDPTASPAGLEYYDSSGVYRANFRSENSNLTGNKIHGLTVDRSGRIWVGTSGQGLLYFTPPAPGDTPDFRLVALSGTLDIQGLAAVGDTIWALTTSDVRWYGRFSGSLGKIFGLPAAPALLALNPLAVAPDHNLWVGTVNGIRVYRPDGTTVADYTTANSPLADDEVRAIRIEKSGVVWIATSGGLNRFDPHYVAPPPPRLPSLTVRAYPNPALMASFGVGLSLVGNGTRYRGSVHDLNGRLLKRFENVANGQVFWDTMDQSGVRARPGLYFVRVEAGGRSAVVRVTLLR